MQRLFQIPFSLMQSQDRTTVSALRDLAGVFGTIWAPAFAPERALIRVDVQRRTRHSNSLMGLQKRKIHMRQPP
ncbi:hypothetical protein SAMN04488045_0061 [Thalassococcus halodurans]|uniref:Uncharacterized protein n=1 Tax=Thalassococcus halodurans TaxID=373675 RepID=A0A1H5S0M5_9RHOB|nr:hypothetical protein SAMN04488045_0061 [Thalassococcus halodurans]